MKALGRYILDRVKGSFEPYFTVQEDRKYENAQVPISEDVLKDMYIRGRFIMEPIHITVSKQLSKTTIYLCLQEGSYPHSGDSNLPLSGFPRTLMTEELTQSKSCLAPNRHSLLTDGKEPLPSTAIHRNSGSLKGRPNRRLRQIPKTPSSGESSSSHPSSLRRVKSQSNLNQAGTQPEIGFPTSPEDVSQWSRRHNSVDMGTHPSGIYELDDTSPTAAP
jgi:hypothetical protein